MIEADAPVDRRGRGQDRFTIDISQSNPPAPIVKSRLYGFPKSRRLDHAGLVVMRRSSRLR